MEFFSPHHLIQLLHTYGYSVLAIVIGLECVGLPLPGETVLIASAVLAGTMHQLNIGLVVLFASLGAIIGQAAGYWIGWGVGFRLLRRYGHYIGLTNQTWTFASAPTATSVSSSSRNIQLATAGLNYKFGGGWW